jgi:hypothetical protein
MRHCYSSIYCILSDHPSQVLCASTFINCLVCLSSS